MNQPVEPISVERVPAATASAPEAPKARSRRFISLGIAGAVIALAFFLFLFAHRKPGAEGETGGRLPIVAVAKVTKEDLVQTLTVAGEFRPYQQVALHAKIAGYLQSISVDVGDHVREGQAIAQLDVPELKDELEKSSASLRASEQEVGRAEATYKEAHLAWQRLADVAKQRPKLVAPQDLDTSEARDATTRGGVSAAKQRVEECQAEVNKAHSLLGYMAITAPFDGVITKRFADPGALIQAGTSSSTQAMPVVDIAEDKRLRLTFPVPESSVAVIEVGAPVRITVDALGVTTEAKISRFSGKVDRATRTMSTEADIENDTGRFKPGMYASVSLIVNQSKGAVVVPVQALSAGEKPTVLIVGNGDRIEERPVKPGLQTPSKVEVSGGLQPGDFVVVGSRGSVQPGQRIRPKIVETDATN